MSGFSDFPRDVYAWPYFDPVTISTLIAPAMNDVLQQVVPPMVDAIVTQEAQAAVQALALLRSGDTMLGHLFLNHAIPTVDSEVASKLYVDMKTAGAGITEPTSTGNFLRAMNGAGSWVQGLPLSGGTLTGTLTLDADATQPLEATTLQQVEDLIDAADTIPEPIATGNWLRTMNGAGSWTAGLPLSGGSVTGQTTFYGLLDVGVGPAGQLRFDAGTGTPFVISGSGGNLALGGPGSFNTSIRINDSGPFNAGTNLVNRDYVQNAIGELQAFEGAWDAANNDPDLTSITVNNGSYFIASSAGTAPTALPGIGDEDIRPGDMIVWNGTLSEWQIIPGAGMTQNEADARFLQLAGGMMTAVTGAAGGGTGISIANSSTGNAISLTNTGTGVGLLATNTGGAGSAAISAMASGAGTGIYVSNGSSYGIRVWRASGVGVSIRSATAGVTGTALSIGNDGSPSTGIDIGSVTETNSALEVWRWNPDTTRRWLLRHDGSMTATVDTGSTNAPLLITTTTANNAPEQKFRVGLNGATTVGQPTGPAVTTAGSVNVADNFYRNGVPLTTDQLQFRAMTPDLRNWIPVGLEGTFVGQGTGIVNAPTNGSWRYLAFARASGNLEIIAFQNGNLSVMKPTRTGQLRQRIVRTNRDSSGNWSYDNAHNSLPGSWGEYQRPLFSSESQGASIGNDNRGGNLMKLAGRNLLERIPGGNINFGPRFSGPMPYRNPYNLSLSHARLIARGSSQNTSNSMHLIENIHKLDMATAFGTVMDRSVSGTSIMGFNVDMSPWHEPYGRRWVRYRQFVQPGTGRFPFRIAFNVSSPGTYAGWLWEKRVVVILDCRTLGTGARWVRADGTADATDATMIQGMYFPPWLQVRVEFITSHVSADASPSGKVYRVEFDSSYNYGFVTCRVHAFGAAPMTSYAGS